MVVAFRCWARGLRKAFGALVAVNDVSFEVMPGQIFGIAGPNGSGKSTLFNLLTGIPFGPDKGEVHFDGAGRIRPAGHTRSPAPASSAPFKRMRPSKAYPPVKRWRSPPLMDVRP